LKTFQNYEVLGNKSFILYAISPLFMIKLILGFAVRRPDLTGSNEGFHPGTIDIQT